MALQTERDIPLFVRSNNASCERRITPSWTLAQLKAKLEPITGIPPPYQSLQLKLPGQDELAMEALDEEEVQLSGWSLQAYAEIYVKDLRPSSVLTNFTDVSSVPKYTMPSSTYETLPDSVLAWKKSQKLGRFDPSLPEQEAEKIRVMWIEIADRKIAVSARCRLGTDSARRGTVAYMGEVENIPGAGPWVGVMLDEPVGRNDGSVSGKRYFTCADKRGVFVRPGRVEVGDWPVLMDEDDDLEEL